MSNRVMLITTVPPLHLDAVLQALGDAGAGTIGHYTHCAFTSIGTGRFRPDAAATPAVGEKQVLNTVDEVRIETWCDQEKVAQVCAALRTAHPYEEPVIYLIPLLDEGEI